MRDLIAAMVRSHGFSLFCLVLAQDYRMYLTAEIGKVLDG